MGIGLVLVFWVVVGTVLASIGMLVFGTATLIFTHGVKEGRAATVTAAGLFPYGCLVWLFLIFMLQVQIQDTFGRWFWFEAAGDSGSAAGCSGLIKAGHSDRIEAGS